MGTKTDNGWIPRHHPGGIYCSPKCGGRCTREAHDKAIENAAKLARRMGRGWYAMVWENLGWHFNTVKGAARIHISGEVYTVFLETMLQVVTSADTPEEALRDALTQTRDNAAQMIADCDEVGQ